MELSINPRTISLGTKCANDQIARCARFMCAAQRVDFLDVGRHRHEFGFSQGLQLASLRGNALDSPGHLAAEHPDDRNEARADQDRENKSIELKLADVLDEVILGRQQQYVAAVTLAERELRHPEEEAFPGFVLDGSFIIVLVVRAANHRGHDSRIELVDAGQ